MLLCGFILLLTIIAIAAYILGSHANAGSMQQKTTEVIKAILPHRQHGRTPLMLGSSPTLTADDESSCGASSSVIRVR